MSVSTKRPNRKLVFLTLIGLTVFTIVAGVAIGPVYVPLGKSFLILLSRLPFLEFGNFQHAFEVIITQIRLPRVLLGLLVGLSLAISGGVMQGIFHNPLASPYILGIASGASAGAALVVILNMKSIFALPLGAFFGGAVVVALVYKLAEGRGGKTSIYTLILAGVALGALFSALTSFLIFLAAGSERIREIVFWIMGGLGRANWIYFYILMPTVAFGLLVIIIFSRDLNALALGEEGAMHLGIDAETVKRILLGTTTLLTSAAVAFAGTIGFIGLITPHMMRLLMGPDHRFLLPATALAGAIFLIWADTAARIILQPAELPVGIITAFFGAPFFLYLLKTRRGGGMG